MDIKKDKTLGYWYFIDKSHHLASPVGRVYYHRHVWWENTGDDLTGYHIHHIDGDKDNNSFDNLEKLTPSDHGCQHKPAEYVTKICPVCKVAFETRLSDSATFCSTECSWESYKRFDPTKEELEELVWSKPTVQLAKDFGVSDVAIAKRCKKFGIKKPPRGYWRKLETGKL